MEHDDDVKSVAWSPDGSKICTGSFDKTAQVWDMEGATVLDWAVRGIGDGGDIEILEFLLSHCESLEGLCNDNILSDLVHIQEELKNTDSERYAKLEKVITLELPGKLSDSQFRL